MIGRFMNKYFQVYWGIISLQGVFPCKLESLPLNCAMSQKSEEIAVIQKNDDYPDSFAKNILSRLLEQI